MPERPCCKEAGCHRTSPLLIRRGDLSGRWYLITDYQTVDSGILLTRRRHDVTTEVQNAVIADVLTKLSKATKGMHARDRATFQGVLDRVATDFGLSPKEAPIRG